MTEPNKTSIAFKIPTRFIPEHLRKHQNVWANGSEYLTELGGSLYVIGKMTTKDKS